MIVFSFFLKISNDEFSEKNIYTIGLDKRTLFYKDIEIELNGIIKKENFNILLYDTTGQERYRAITKTYFQGSDVVILFYDITDRKSFENIEVWLESISQVLSNWKNSNYIIVLLFLTQWQTIADCKVKRLIAKIISLILRTFCKWKMICGIHAEILVVVGKTKRNCENRFV